MTRQGDWGLMGARAVRQNNAYISDEVLICCRTLLLIISERAKVACQLIVS